MNIDRKQAFKKRISEVLAATLLLLFVLFSVAFLRMASPPPEPQSREGTFCMKTKESGEIIYAMIWTKKREDLEKEGFKCVTKTLPTRLWDSLYRLALKHEISQNSKKSAESLEK